MPKYIIFRYLNSISLLTIYIVLPPPLYPDLAIFPPIYSKEVVTIAKIYIDD